MTTKQRAIFFIIVAILTSAVMWIATNDIKTVEIMLAYYIGYAVAWYAETH